MVRTDVPWFEQECEYLLRCLPNAAATNFLEIDPVTRDIERNEARPYGVQYTIL